MIKAANILWIHLTLRGLNFSFFFQFVAICDDLKVQDVSFVKI